MRKVNNFQTNNQDLLPSPEATAYTIGGNRNYSIYNIDANPGKPLGSIRGRHKCTPNSTVGTDNDNEDSCLNVGHVVLERDASMRRYVIKDAASGNIVDNAQGFGFKTEEKAFSYAESRGWIVNNPPANPDSYALF